MLRRGSKNPFFPSGISRENPVILDGMKETVVSALFLFLPPAICLLLPQSGTPAGSTLGIFLGLLALVVVFFPSPLPKSRLSRGRQAALGFAVYAGLVLLIQYSPLGEWLCRPLLLPHSQGNADAIVTVAGGHQAAGMPTFGGLQRFLHATKLLSDGRAPFLVVSTSAITNADGSRESDWVASLTPRLGIASGCMLVLKEGHNTISEARAVARALFPKGLKRILVVTHGPHILRTVRCFEAQGFEVLPAPVHEARTLDAVTGHAFTLFNYAVHEWIGNIWYWLRGDIAFPFRRENHVQTK
jgi:uncharacterized SAM-binding protein YcdF (DUF218 family)